MKYSNFGIFEEYYLLQIIKYDIQAAYLEHSSENALIEAAGQMSCFIDLQ